MGRILAIDFGAKRTGLAATDPMRLIPNGITTVDTRELERWIAGYIEKEDVDIIVVGYPKTLRNEPAQIVGLIEPFVERLRRSYPAIEIELIDERFTSRMAFQTMVDSGIGRKKRQDKALIDQISATIILQNYMDWHKF